MLVSYSWMRFLTRARMQLCKRAMVSLSSIVTSCRHGRGREGGGGRGKDGDGEGWGWGGMGRGRDGDGDGWGGGGMGRGRDGGIKVSIRSSSTTQTLTC